MSGARLLVGTLKGAFSLAPDGRWVRWDISGSHFGGCEIYHLTAFFSTDVSPEGPALRAAIGLALGAD